MTDKNRDVLYWDASAVLSLLFTDSHSDTAVAWARSGAVHLISTLACAESSAVIAHLQRDQAMTDVLAQSVRNSLSNGPWRRTTVQPAWETIHPLATRWPLRGAALWHLACAKGLQQQLPELHLLTFDNRLHEAALGEGLIQPQAGP